MSILDILGNSGGLLGNSGGSSGGTQASHSSNDFGAVIGSSPGLDLSASNILHATDMGGSHDGSSSLTGIGDLGVGLSAPTVVGVSDSSDHQTYSDSSGSHGGLLGGIL